jgi:hypothetical protein
MESALLTPALKSFMTISLCSQVVFFNKLTFEQLFTWTVFDVVFHHLCGVVVDYSTVTALGCGCDAEFIMQCASLRE